MKLTASLHRTENSENEAEKNFKPTVRLLVSIAWNDIYIKISGME